MLLPNPKEMRPGGPLDLGTLKGCVRCFILGWIGFFCMWHVDKIGNWVDWMIGVSSDPVTIGQIRFQRFLAISLAGTTIVSSFFIGLSLYIRRRREKRSSKGE